MASKKTKKATYYTHRGQLYRRDSTGDHPYFGNEAQDPRQRFQQSTPEDLKADYVKPQVAWWQGIANDPTNQAAATGIYAAKNPMSEDQVDLRAGQYTNPAATNALNSPQIWNYDQNLGKASSQMQQALNDPQAFSRDPNLSKLGGNVSAMANRLQNGPGQAFNPGQLASLYAMGMQNLGQQNRNFTAGLAGANAGRGTVGVNPSAMLHSQNASQNRAALAQGNLDAQMQGLNLGVNQYNASAGVLNTVGGLANQAANRSQDTIGQLGQLAGQQSAQNLETQKLDYAGRLANKDYAQQQAMQAQRAVDNFMTRYGIELTATSGGEQGDQIKENLRKELEGLQHNRDVWQSNLSRYA